MFRLMQQFRGSRARKAIKKRAVTRLNCEALESRMVLSAFTPGDLVIYRIGDSGDPAGTSAATNTYLDEYTPSGVLVQTIELTTGGTPDFTDSGKATNDGVIVQGPGGDNIAAFGYDIPKGHASATSTAGTESIGVVGENGVVTLNTTTVDANNNARSAVYDSTSGKLYVAGGNGVYEASLSSLTSTPGTFTQIYATSSDQVGIFGGRLFITTSHGIFDAGAEPTTAVTPTQLTSVDAGGSVTINTGSYTTGSPLTFFFANLGSGHNYNSTGDDTLYIIDTKGGSGAVLKYSYNGSSWTYEGGRAGPDTTSGAQLLGLTGSVSGSTATLYLTEGNDGSGATSELYTLTDSGGSTGSITSTALSQITLGTSGAGTGSTSSPTSSIYENFRNVAFAPTASALALGGLTAANFTTGGSAVILTGGNGTFADTLSSSQLNTSTLSIAITANGDSAHDVLAVNNQGTAAGQIGVSGSNITYTYLSGSATTIGSFTGGSGGSSLVVTLNSSATATAVQALYNQITFSTTSSSTTSRTVQFTFTPSVGSPVSASESVNIAPVGTPFISPGSSITLGENYGSYSTLLTGIGDGNSPNDNNADTTISAAVTAGGVGLFSSSPAVTGFNHTTGTATLGFTLASNASGTATITVTVTNTVTSNTTTATFNLTVNAITVTSVAPSVATGNAVDVLTTNLSAAETGVTATNTVYTITTLPTDGSLYLNGTGALGLGDTFTQQDVVFGLIYYVSTGSTSATDTVGFSVSDSAGGSVSGQTLNVAVIKPQAFTPGDIVIERWGDQGDFAGSSSATNVWLDEYSPAGVLVQSIPVPDSTQNGNLAFTDSGKAATGGQMTLGPDGQDLALYGYNLDAGTGGATGSAAETTAAVVGTNGLIQTEGFNNNSHNNARSAVYDATNNQLYISGANGLAESGFTNGSTVTATSLFGSSAGTTEIFNGQLYYSSTANGGVYAVGTGEPISSTTPTALPLQGGGTVDGIGASVALDNTGLHNYSAGAPLAFYFARLGTGTAYNGEDTLYVIDENSGGGALLKYSYNGTAWVSEGAIAGPSTGDGTQLVGLTGTESGGVVTLYISAGNTGSGATGEVFKVTDSSGSTGTLYMGSTPGSLGSAIINVGSSATPSSSTYENFRGIAFAPALLPSWLAPGSQATWNPSTHTLTVAGNAQIIADPGTDSPIIVGSSSAADLTIVTPTATFVNLGGIELSGGASINVASFGGSRSHTNHDTLVLDSNGTTVPAFEIDNNTGPYVSTFNLNDSDMIVQNGGGTDPVGGVSESDLAAVENAAYNARDVAAGSGLGGAWDLPGLTSSAAKALDVAGTQGYEYTTLGIALVSNMPLGAPNVTLSNPNGTWFAGSSSLALGANDVIVKYTYNGDFALEGQVGTDDQSIFTTFNGTTGLNPKDSFDDGDTNGDGVVDSSTDDGTIFAANNGDGFGGTSGNQL